MKKRGYTIGEAAALSGVKVPTIRYYEQVGLMPEGPRTDGNRRIYGEAEVRRLSFIRHARELGFEPNEIRTLLALQDDPGQPCVQADAIAQARLKDVERRIGSLKSLQAELERMIRSTSHGTIADCRVIEALSSDRTH